jgi:hypothetical protein
VVLPETPEVPAELRTFKFPADCACTLKLQVNNSQNQKVANNFYEFQKETFDATLQVLKDEIVALREERKQFLALIERITLK